MHLRSLYLHNFRIYEEAFFEFSPNLNVIRGPNARGKTSLLEAIYFLMIGRSFRASQTSEMIRHGASFFYIEASFLKYDIEQKLRISYNGKDRKIIYNTTKCSSFSSLLGLLQGVVIHPDDAAIVKGAPSIRRHLLDMQLAQADPLYVHHLTRYERAMRQRNILLKARSSSTIESWEYEMANAASYVVQQRAQATSDLQLHAKKLYHHFCLGTEDLGLIYKAHGVGQINPIKNERLCSLYFDQYQRHRDKEMSIGTSLTGPHKDDLIITLGNKDTRAFASEGQQRSCIVALKLAEWERLKDLSHHTPIMLVDDFGMSLDISRRSQILKYFATLKQVFLTTTEEDSLLNAEHTILM